MPAPVKAVSSILAALAPVSFHAFSMFHPPAAPDADRVDAAQGEPVNRRRCERSFGKDLIQEFNNGETQVMSRCNYLQVNPGESVSCKVLLPTDAPHRPMQMVQNACKSKHAYVWKRRSTAKHGMKSRSLAIAFRVKDCAQTRHRPMCSERRTASHTS